MKTAVNQREGFALIKRKSWRVFGLLTLCVAAISMAACIAAIPVAIMYAKKANETVVNADMPAPPEKVYKAAVSLAEEKNVKIVNKEEDKFYIEVTDGVQTASLKAEAAGADKSKVTIVASISSEETKEQKQEQRKELALRIVDRVCEKLQVKCTIIKE